MCHVEGHDERHEKEGHVARDEHEPLCGGHCSAFEGDGCVCSSRDFEHGGEARERGRRGGGAVYQQKQEYGR